jgi:hypothetical protein
MSTHGVSLVGFLDEVAAIAHLRSECVPTSPSDEALASLWKSARERLGSPISGAGYPSMDAIPAAYSRYIDGLRQAPWLQSSLNGPWAGATFCMVEIDKLLAFRVFVDVDRAAQHCSRMSRPPTVQEMLETCLPHQLAGERIDMWEDANKQSMLIKSRSLNVMIVDRGAFTDSRVGISVGVSLPLLHVVSCNGKYYLHNGFHRAYGLRKAGATHAPCILRDVKDHAAVGIKADGSTFSAALLESNNPPTFAHYTQGRAYPVMVRSVSRFIQVSWSEYAIADE